MWKVFLVAMFVLFADSTLRSDCKCFHPDKAESTRWGGNEMIVVVKKEPVKQLYGRIEGQDGRPIEGALVEIFTHPEYLLSDLPNARRDRPEQQRVASCLTRADGKFCIRHLPPGTYELRSSISRGWNVTHVHVTVDPERGGSEEVFVTMHIGT